MGDFPDPDEEYELMYADELEMLREDDDSSDHNIVKKNPLPAKRSLDFSSPTVRKHLPIFTTQKSQNGEINNSFDGINSLPLSQPSQPNQPSQPIQLSPYIAATSPSQPIETTSNKRTVDDLFGDIGDIEDDILLPSKKQKTEEEEDEELISKIMEGRRLRQMLLEPSNRLQGNAKPNFNTKENISVEIPRWAFMPVTNSDGERFYVRLESEDSWEQSLDTTNENASLQANYAKTWTEARKLLEEKHEQHLAVQSQEVQVLKDENDNLMWVDRFRPQSYVDLLSEEPVNRALLHWLHLWDKIVFKKEVKTKDPQQRTKFSKRAGEFQLTNKWKGKREAEPEVDEDGRPHHKLALLCGPPGVGKTTLAHLLAKLAGEYEVAGEFQLTNKWKGKREAEPEVGEDGRPHHKVALLCGPPGVGKTTLAHLLAKLAGEYEVAGEFQLTNKWKGKREAEPEVGEDGRPHHKVALLCGPPGVGKTTLAHLLAKLAGEYEVAGEFQLTNKWKGKREAEPEVGEDGRPHHKVALLCGPPGVGKTTLAHLLAKLAGEYEVAGEFQLTNKWKGKREAEPEVDEDGRPHHKVALLCGPPGVGKTTLAHLLAKLAGEYEVAGEFQLTNKWKGKREAEPEVGEDGRPHHKVALLCGPPGVGKTTLAHLLAKLAGYRPVELNASDERSTEAFRTALHNATLMRSVLDPDRRPNCLILDEIDGAPLPTVELLVKWCTASAAAGGKKAKTQPLRRPVIAICNNLYAASLRPLRLVSLILQVSTVSLPRLTARLSHAAKGVAPRVAAAVAARTHPDVRAALHLLSFLDRLKGAKQVTIADVEKASIGTKDCHKSLMQALQAVFTINDKDTDILKTVQAAGEYDRLADGIFENYLQARVDSRLHIACETLSWLRLYDTIYAWTLRTQNYSLYGALPLCIARCHTVLASRTPQRIKFPTQAQEMHRRQMELESTISCVARDCVASVALSRTALRLSVVPLLPHLLAPALRSANVQLCSENERKALRACAGAMCDYGLQYVQQRTPEGLYAFVLEPDIHKIAFFGNEDRARPPPPIRLAIAREQQLEVIRRNEEMANRVSGRKSTEDSSKPRTETVKPPPKETKDAPLPNHLQRLKPKEVTKAAPQVHKDFFGRIVPLSQVQRNDAVPDVISSSSVFYQYREGFNNAVRRNVRTKDLL